MPDVPGAGDHVPRPLFVFSGGFVTQRRVARILDLAGWPVRLGLPGPGDAIGIWGGRGTAARGRWMAARRDARLVTVEDAFLRSVRPGRMGDPPLGLLIDPEGLHFDPARPSRIERILSTDPLDDPELLSRSTAAIARLIASDLSKYTFHDPDLPAPDPGYVLVVDQTAGDASVTASGADAATFAAMLACARRDHPDRPVVIRTHPETAAGLRPGHFGPQDALAGDLLLTEPVSPWRMLAGAAAVYTVSSQLGFEAILAGHRPRVFGQPFYVGWGLSEDERPPPRRDRRLTAAQLFAGAMILAPTWYDPCRDRLCPLEDAIAQLEAETRVWREDRHGHVAAGMRLWKRGHLQRFFGGWRPLRFDGRAPVARAGAEGRGVLIWAGTDAPAEDPARTPRGRLWRVEDGFLRSRGLGADLVPPLSLVADDLGIYYDAGRESRLERMVAEAACLPPQALRRAERLAQAVIAARLTKYNLPGLPSDLPPGRRILVPGQVEDDASIRLGCGDIRTNLGLLRAARTANPGAVLVYKPHPDVEAGLRPGAIAPADLHGLADVVATRADPVALIEAADEIWTLTSLLGFEALIRGKPVTCLGAPFYAGWGLTRDLGPVPPRRSARPTLAALIHAALIAYPRYRDPVSGLPCPPEVVVDRLASGRTGPNRPALRMLAKAQGLVAGWAWVWR